MPSNISNFLKSLLVLMFVVVSVALNAQCYFHELYRYQGIASFENFTSVLEIEGTDILVTGACETSSMAGYISKIKGCGGDTIWQSAINYINIGAEVGVSTIPHRDSIIVIGYAFDSLQGKREGYVAFLDTLGNIAERKTIDAGNINEIIKGAHSEKDGILIGGYFNEGFLENIFLYKIDFHSNVLWRKTYGLNGTFCNVKNIDKTKDGGFVIGGYYYSGPGVTQLFIIKIDSSGVKEWGKAYPNTFYQGAVKQTHNGDYILVGNTHPSTNEYYAYIGKMDANGDTIWQKQFNYANAPTVFVDVKTVNSESFIALGSSLNGEVYIGKYKVSDGSEIWSRTYEKYYAGTNSREYGEQLLITSSGDLVVAGYIAPLVGSNYNNDALVLKVDSCGYLNNNSIDAQFNLQQNSQTVNFTNLSQGYCTSYWYFGDGNTSNASNPTHSYATDGIYTVTLIVRAGNSLDTITQQVNIGNVSVENIPNKQVLLYPNPTNELLNIELTNTQADSYSITDITGRVVLADNISSSKQIIHIANLSKGVYFLSVTHQGKVVATGKVFKE